MVYIKHGRSMEEEDWLECIAKKSVGLFLSALLKTLYPAEEYLKKCVIEGDNVLTPSKTKKRTAFTSVEMDVFGSKF